jgi:hypothetical protein
MKKYDRPLGVVQKLRQQFWNYFELLSPYSERSVCAYATDRIGGKQPKETETGNVNLIFERLLSFPPPFRDEKIGYGILCAFSELCFVSNNHEIKAFNRKRSFCLLESRTGWR